MKRRENSKKAENTIREVKIGSVSVNIYQGTNRKNGKEYPIFTLVYFDQDKRQRRSFANLDRALEEARLIAMRLSRGQQEALKLTNADASSYIHAMEELKPLGLPLHVAIKEYLHARTILNGQSLAVAAEEMAARSKAGVQARTVSSVVDQLIKEQIREGKSKRYLETLRSHLNRFKNAFQIEIAQVTTLQMEAWLSTVGGGIRTRNNLRGSLVTLFQFARRLGYLPRGVSTEAEELSRGTNPPSSANTYTPAELQDLLFAAQPKILPALAIAAFTGLRAASIGRLQWENVLWEQGFVEVPAAIAKNRKRYLVPLPPCLSAWLATYRGKKGRIIPGTRMEHWMAEAFKVAGLKRLHNGLRDSFISYRVAQTMNLPQVAYEAGNSVEMIRSKYLEARTKAEAEAWFSVFPERPANIVILGA